MLILQMKKSSLTRKAHFIGPKIRNLRKSNRLTMEDLSMRCIQIDADSAPSVSYLSMIENGKRVPSEKMLDTIAEVFQKEVEWFLDESFEAVSIPSKANKGGIAGIPLEPGFLFEKDHLQIVIPEMLSQTGTTGRQFAHLLIRAHQEHHQNNFPDLEKAAEEIGQKQLPISLEQIKLICKNQGLTIHWFERKNIKQEDKSGNLVKTVVRSFFEAPNKIYVNKIMQKHPERLKYDLATHIGHKVLHGSDGFESVNIAGRGSSQMTHGFSEASTEALTLNSEDILRAWRHFECSFFAAALLCPKAPLRQYLNRNAYSINTTKDLEVSSSVLMRRMTAVSPYPHWHYFDAYTGGNLKAVYRGNGIPLPWGNMRLVADPCKHWAVFRMLNDNDQSSAQISVMNNGSDTRIYCCESTHTKDLANNPHVLCAGVDLNPALESQGKNANEIATELMDVCRAKGGTSRIPKHIKDDLRSVAKILNIEWIERGIEEDAMIICPRSELCPRQPECVKHQGKKISTDNIHSIREEIIAASK